ncbi:hypothetical protein [Pseudolactococcus carnosus]|uniref:Tfp pilus assembly protein PilO n=1 Tax=Pseudolactococcus carnosus TaxID=2749961 RepID=A0ABT0AUN2_9LACT|nr:hypothetical protein [Lactococcus carnosus]MCJ1990398.1 hypothetical protein [Lactococcus carnosus]
MTKVQFTPKLIIMSILILLVSLAILSGLWFTLNGNMLTTKGKLDTELKELNTSVSSLKIETQQLTKQKKLVESDMMIKAPKIPNGIQIGEFLTDLEKFVTDTNMVINSTEYKPMLVYPADKDNAGPAPSSLYKMVSKFEVSGATAANCQKLIDALENQTRYVNVTELAYNASPKYSEYTISITFSTFFLSEYDTYQQVS